MNGNVFPLLDAASFSSPGILDRLPGPAKVLLVLLFSLCIATTRSMGAQLFLLAYAILLVLLARVPARMVFSRLFVLDGFLLMIWITLPFSAENGVGLALSVSIRAHGAVLAFLALLRTTPMPELLRSLATLRTPQKLVVLLHFTYRYAHVFTEEARKIRLAMDLRLFSPTFSIATLRACGNLAGMLIVRSILRSGRVHDAMILRGFHGDFPFTPSQNKPSSSDILHMGVLYIALAGVFLYDAAVALT